MSNNNGAAGVIPTISMFDYLQPGIKRPDLFAQSAYPVSGGGGGSPKSLQKHDASGEERSPYISLYYTLGLVVVSAGIFISLAAWANVLLSWIDSIYVNPVIQVVTQSRLYYAIIITIISIIVIIILLYVWYYFTIENKN
jgi:hypothetical protein